GRTHFKGNLEHAGGGRRCQALLLWFLRHSPEGPAGRAQPEDRRGGSDHAAARAGVPPEQYYEGSHQYGITASQGRRISHHLQIAGGADGAEGNRGVSQYWRGLQGTRGKKARAALLGTEVSAGATDEARRWPAPLPARRCRAIARDPRSAAERGLH